MIIDEKFLEFPDESFAEIVDARVEGTNPKSYGNDIPAGSTFFRVKTCCFASNAYLLRLPFGVSITTHTLL